MTRRFDALVIGGGPAGATSAILLAQAGWLVALLERKKFPRRKVCGEYLSPTNWPLLEAIGLSAGFHEIAGPEVRKVGLLSGAELLTADLPAPNDSRRWGRALARERLDTMLLRRAAELGVQVWQPWSGAALTEEGDYFVGRAVAQESRESRELVAPVAIAAHGSWDCGSLPTQPHRPSQLGSDLFGFKAHFRNCALPEGLMPLVAFPDGYGGMVHCDGGRVSFSCCIRHRRLRQIRCSTGSSAGAAVWDYILQSCPALGPIFAHAEREGAWLSAGPIRPGIRPRYYQGIFAVGNAAGEAHPVVAEGITMAMQSAWLLARLLVQQPERSRARASRDRVGREYSAIWYRSFAPRLHAASLFAHWAMRPLAVNSSLALIRWYPAILTLGSRLSGKATMVVATT